MPTRSPRPFPREDPPYAYPGSFEERFLANGTGPLSPQLVIPEALTAHEELEAAGYRNYAHSLVARFAEQFLDAFRCGSLGGRFGNMVTLPLPALVGEARAEEMAYRRLFFEKHRIEVPFTSIPGDDRLFVRPSAHAYTRPADLDRLLRALLEEFPRTQFPAARTR